MEEMANLSLKQKEGGNRLKSATIYAELGTTEEANI